MTRHQQTEVQSRKRMPSKTTDEQKWIFIYRILFPETGLTNIPSPCKYMILITSCFPVSKREVINAIVDLEDEDMLAPSYNSSIPSQAICENILMATPKANLERSVKTDIWQILCSSDDTPTKMERVYNVVCGFPKRLIDQEHTSLSKGA